MWPTVTIDNNNQMQGPTAEVERHLLFIGEAPAAAPERAPAGPLLALDTRTDLDALLGEADSALKANLAAARDNAGLGWTATAYVLANGESWLDAARAAQAFASYEGIVVLGQTWDAAGINAAQSLNQALIATWGRWQYLLLAMPDIARKPTGKGAKNEETGQTWADYVAALTALQKGITAEAVALVPQLWPTLIGAYAGRLCNHAVSVADSPCRVKTGPLKGLTDLPVDAKGEPLSLLTLQVLEEARYAVPMWYPDVTGYYWADGRQLDAEGGDYQVIENLRAVYKVARRMRLRAIPRLGDRTFNATPGSTAAAVTYFGKVLRDMAKPITLAGESLPGDIAPPQDGDVVIQWLTKNRVAIAITVRTVDCPKGITISLTLDLNLNNGEG